MKKEVKNLPASVHDRLKQLAKDGRRPFQDLFYYYAIERFLYRLSRSPYIEKLILKGALLFVGWRIFPRRPTRDIDVQGSIGNSVEGIVEIVKVICTTPCEPDGMRFDPDSIKGEEIMTDSNYHGVRVQFTGYLGISPVHLHLDVSFTNVITPKETLLSYPCMLGMPDFKIYAYPYETSIAEKFQAMVSLGNINDRMKDFYDIWLLTEKLDMRADTLVRAIQATFQERNTPLPHTLPTALTEEFAHQKQLTWARFLKRSNLNDTELPSFDSIVQRVKDFLLPLTQAAVNNKPFEKMWISGKTWKSID